MAFFIRPKRSNVPGKVPGQEGETNKFSLTGEIAINLSDQVIYTKASDSDIDSDLARFPEAVVALSAQYQGSENVEVSNGTIGLKNEISFERVTVPNVTSFQPNEAVTRSYVDQSLSGVTVFDPIQLYWDSDINDFNLNTLTNFNLNNGDKVVVNRSTNTSLNGVFVVDNTLFPIPLRRDSDFLTDSDYKAGSFVLIRRNISAGTGIVLRTDVVGAADLSNDFQSQFPQALTAEVVPQTVVLGSVNDTFLTEAGISGTGAASRIDFNAPSLGAALRITSGNIPANLSAGSRFMVAGDTTVYTITGYRNTPSDSVCGITPALSAAAVPGAAIIPFTTITQDTNVPTASIIFDQFSGINNFTVNVNGTPASNIAFTGDVLDNITTNTNNIIVSVGTKPDSDWYTTGTIGGVNSQNNLLIASRGATVANTDSDNLGSVAVGSQSNLSNFRGNVALQGAASDDRSVAVGVGSTAGGSTNVAIGNVNNPTDNRIRLGGPALTGVIGSPVVGSYSTISTTDSDAEYVETTVNDRNMLVSKRYFDSVSDGIGSYFALTQGDENDSEGEFISLKLVGDQTFTEQSSSTFTQWSDTTETHDSEGDNFVVEHTTDQFGNFAQLFDFGSDSDVGNRTIFLNCDSESETRLRSGEIYHVRVRNRGTTPGTTSQVTFSVLFDSDVGNAVDLSTIDPNNTGATNAFGPAPVNDNDYTSVNTTPIDGSILNNPGFSGPNIMFNIYVWDANNGDISVHRA